MGLLSWLLGKPKAAKEAQQIAEPARPRRQNSHARIQWNEGSFPLDAVGESNYQTELERICGGHSRQGHELTCDACLLREPQNPYDPNAVAVTIDGVTVGYLPRDQAKRVAAQMEEDGIDRADCGAKVVGGWRTNQHDEGAFGVRLAVPKRDWIDFGLGKQPPARKTQPDRKKKPARPEAAKSGPLFGQYVVIWGATDFGSEAQELAALGAHIMAGVGKSTTMVVQIDDELTPGMQVSSTYVKAQQRIAEGTDLEIVTLTALRARLGSDPQ